MRWIDIGDYTPSDDWLNKANEVTRMLKLAKTKKERTKIIKDNSNLWGDLKTDLLEISNGKCWYSEAKKRVSFFDVDHFRPKNNVKTFEDDFETANSNEGYWWLAFQWKNYRPSGEICNRKKSDDYGVCRGKQDYFPLIKGCRIASTPDHDLEHEMPVLLDPTVYEDTVLISFDINGEPMPAAAQGTLEYARAKITIKLLYLDYPLLNEARLEVWNYCERLLNEAASIMSDRDAVSLIIEKRKKEIFQELRKLKSPKSEFSTVALACISQSELPWARLVLGA